MTFEVCGSEANKRHLSPQKQGQKLVPKFYRRQFLMKNSNKQGRNDLLWKGGLWTLSHFLLNESKECKEIYLDATLSGDC